MADMIRFSDLFWQPGDAALPILQDLSGEFAKGEFWAILGPNGAGKSTLFRTLMGFIRPDSGEIRIDEKRLEDIPRRELSHNIAYLPQRSVMDLDLDVIEVIRMARYSRLGLFESLRREDHLAVEEAILRSHCEGLLEQRYNTLSGGERQRVLCARAMAQESDYIFLDEPISNLDLSFQHHLLQSLRQLCDDKAVGIVMVMHDINLAYHYADKVYLMKSGRRIMSGKKSEVMEEETLSTLYDWPLEKISSPRGLSQEEVYFVALHEVLSDRSAG